MRKIKHILALLLAVTAICAVKAQQAPIFTNYENSYATVNPGFGGLSEGVNLLGLYRDQWTGFKDDKGNNIAPRTLLLSGDLPVRMLRGGLSLGIIKDQYGFEDNVDVSLGYSYHLDLGSGTLGIGLALSLVNRTMDFSKAISLVNDPAIPSGKEADMLVDANLGAFWQIPETFYVGASVTNLFETKGKALTSSSSTSASFVGDRTFYLVAGGEIQLNNPMLKILPSFSMMSDIASTQFNLGSKVMYNKRIWLGINYRHQESIDAMIGITIKDIKISYSYDINILGLAVPGSHEVALSYCFKLNFDKTPRTYRSIRYL